MLATSFGNVFWQRLLATSFGNVFWQRLLAMSFGNVFLGDPVAVFNFFPINRNRTIHYRALAARWIYFGVPYRRERRFLIL
jgi:hypothetical protein